MVITFKPADKTPPTPRSEVITKAIKHAHTEGVVTTSEAVSTLFSLQKRGRPKTGSAKTPVTIRLDADLVELMQDSSPEWRTEVNAALRAHYGI